MNISKEKYIVNGRGKRLGVFLDISDYRKLLEQAEMAESIKAYDAAKASGDYRVLYEIDDKKQEVLLRGRLIDCIYHA